MMDAKTLIQILVQCSVLLLVLSVGMRSRWADLVYVFNKPADFARALVAVNVVVPAVAVFLCSLFPLEWPTKGGLLVMAVSPLAPFASGKMLKSSSDRSYDVGLYAALILAAVVIVPLTVAILNPYYARHATVSVGDVSWFVVKTVFIPLLAGIAIATFWPRIAERAAPIANLLTYVILLPISVLILIKSGSHIVGLIGSGALVVITLTVLAGLAAGHWLGGPDPGHRAALSQAAATRHPGIAALIAQGHYQERPQVILAIVLFLLVSLFLTALYGLWGRRRLAQSAAPSG